MRKLKDVVVIGCGASGIAALSKLQRAGLDVVGLEAADRIGGRIHTTDYGNGVVDIGAAWCHGEVGNRVYELAAPLNLLGRPEEEEEWFIFSNGTLMPTGNANTVVKNINEVLRRADKNSERSILRCICDDVPSIADPGKIPVTGPFIEWFTRDNHLGGQVDPDEGKSLKGLVEHQRCPGEFWLHWKGKGYKTILNVLMGSTSPNILLNKVVTSISWKLVDEEEMKPYVRVMCSDGTTIEAKTVIVTVSLGVLKESHRSLFSPPLPGRQATAIERLQFCVLDKIYIEFATQWWPKSPASFKIIWKDEDKLEFTANEKWVTEIYGLRTVECQPKVLLAWIYGKGAETMECQSEANVQAGVEKLMKIIFSLNFNVSRIVSIKRSQWANNKYARGSYSYRSVKTEKSGISAADLAVPLRNMGMPVVFFAGEATSRTHHNSVHGAIETGTAAADSVQAMLSQTAG